MDVLCEKLLVIFQNVNEWLKFAEAKNAVLLAFSGTGITATVTLLATIQNLPGSLKIGVLVTTGLLYVCAFLCALSFLPSTNLEKILWNRSRAFSSMQPKPDDDNFYYFGHLKKYGAVELLDAVNRLYLNGTISTPYGKEPHDLATQIILNSGIAFRKYRLFTYSLYFLICSILSVPVLMLSNLLIFRGL